MQRVSLLIIIAFLSACSKPYTEKVQIAGGQNLYVIDQEKQILITFVDQGDSLEGEIRRSGKQELFFMIQKDRITTSRFTADPDGSKWEIMDLKGTGIPVLKESTDRSPPERLKFVGGEFEPLEKQGKLSGTSQSLTK